jgi:hypothetical protein
LHVTFIQIAPCSHSTFPHSFPSTISTPLPCPPRSIAPLVRQRRALFEEGASTECPNDYDTDQMFYADGKPLPLERGLTDAAGGGIYSIFTPIIANGAGKLGDGEHFLTFLFLLLKFIGSSSWLKLASFGTGTSRELSAARFCRRHSRSRRTRGMHHRQLALAEGRH